MRVRMGAWQLAGPLDVAGPGEVVEVEESVGRLLVQGGYAVKVPQPPVELAMLKGSPERAVSVRDLDVRGL